MTLELMNAMQKSCQAFDYVTSDIVKETVGQTYTRESISVFESKMQKTLDSLLIQEYPEASGFSLEVSFSLEEQTIEITPCNNGKEIKTTTPKDTLGDVFILALMGIA